MFVRCFTLLFLLSANVYANPVEHRHGNREHAHELPSIGIEHTHGNGISGTQIGALNSSNNYTQDTLEEGILPVARQNRISLLCQNFPRHISKECMQVVQEKKRIIGGRSTNAQNIGRNCYVKGSSNSIVQSEKNHFKMQLLNNDLEGLVATYDNFAMCHWSSNNFKAAKKYIDNFDLLLDIIPILKYEGGLICGMGRCIPRDADGSRWHTSHQAVRFIENTLRTKHRGLCKGNACKNLAWKITQSAVSNDFQKSLINKLILNSDHRNRVKRIHEKRKQLIAQKSILKLAAKENILPKGKEWASYIEGQIAELSNELYSLLPELGKIELFNNFSLKDLQNSLKSSETIITYLHSIECRVPLVWNISKNKVGFNRAGKSRKECTTSILKDKILLVKQKISQNNTSLNSINSELQWLSRQLLGSLSLPKPGSSLIFVIDEVMAGLPFELLPTPSGKALGELYNISYAPSAPLLSYLRSIPQKSYKLPYEGFSKDKHGGSLASLNSNQYISLVAKEYGGRAYEEENERSIYERALDSKVLHFITHSGNRNGKHGLFYGKSDNEDGILTGSEINARASIRADTVLISSCDSVGANSYQEVGEAYSDLSRGFLTSGVKRVIVTRWDVSEDVAHRFVTKYLHYTEKNNLTSSEALKKARSEACSINNPKCWAAWMLLGS